VAASAPAGPEAQPDSAENERYTKPPILINEEFLTGMAFILYRPYSARSRRAEARRSARSFPRTASRARYGCR